MEKVVTNRMKSSGLFSSAGFDALPCGWSFDAADERADRRGDLLVACPASASCPRLRRPSFFGAESSALAAVLLVDDALRPDDRVEVRPAPPLVEVWVMALPARVDRRDRGPRTGTRATKIQPTPSTGLPPIRRSSSKSQVCSPWNSWNESFERTTASARSAT